jgi:hypothetical protein
MKTIVYILFTLLATLSINLSAEAQNILLGHPEAEKSNIFPGKCALLNMKEDNEQSLTVNFSLGDVCLDTTDKDFTHLSANGIPTFSSSVGKPSLPVVRRLLTLPQGATFSIEILYDKSSSMSLPADSKSICPAQQSVGKESVPTFRMDSLFYETNQYYGGPLVQLQSLGIMRDRQQVLLSISPIEYNPRARMLRLHDSISIIIHLQGIDAKALAHYQNTENIDNISPVYLVVSVDSFRSSLQPFLAWKRQQGYHVETLFAPVWQRDTLQALLQTRYENSTSLSPAPTYLLLVGDIEQIPTYQGRESVAVLGQHATDLYYAEYTGDYLPDVLIGRFSAHNTQELNAIVQKTLDYEQFALADTTYLNKTLLVAGYEERGNTDTLTNGQVHYLKTALKEAAAAIDTECFYNPASNNQRNDILSAWRQGVGTINYTAHCLATGWHHPQLYDTDIDSMPANGKYFVIVNNCCHSNNYSSECFGESLLRKAGGGAVGVIGATYETLWNEDFYWAIGAKRPFTLFPVYDSHTLGAYDRLLHRHGETRQEQASTLGEMLMAGNSAVMEYGSPYAGYYWEVYCLLGDPSLMPYIGIPSPLTLTVTAIDGQLLAPSDNWQDSVTQGTSSLTFSGTPFARVAIMQDTSLIATCLLDSLGQGILTAEQPFLSDSITLTATAQNRISFIKRLATRRPAAARPVAQSYHLLNSAGRQTDRIFSNDTMRLIINWRNVGSTTAYNSNLSLRKVAGDSDSSFSISIQPASFVIDSLPADSNIKVSYTLVVNADGQTEVGVGLMPNLPLTPQPKDITLCAVTGDSTHTLSQALRFDIERAQIVLYDAKILNADTEDPHHNSATNRLLPGRNYWLMLVANNAGESKARTSRMCITHFEGVSFLANCCHAGVALKANSFDTLFLPLHTADTLSRFYIYLEVDCDNSHTYYSLIFLADSARETFEDANFTHFPWDTLSACPWIIDSTISHNGRYAARSATLDNRQSSELRMNLQVNARDTVAFWFKTIGETGDDKLSFYIDEASRGSWSGVRDWHRVQYLILPGMHTLTWLYQRGEHSTSVNNYAWIDDLRLPLSCLSMTLAGYNDSITTSVSIPLAADNNSFSLYPNPAGQQVFLSNSGLEPINITVLDALGRQCDKLHVPAQSTYNYSLRRLPAGFYTLSILRRKGLITKKLLIVK